MRSVFSRVLLAGLLAMLTACRPSSRQQTDRRTAEAKRKADAEGQRLRDDAHRLGQNIHQALNGTGTGASPTQSAEEKLRRGGEDLRVAGGEAAVKLDRAAVIAKVKTKLATATGLSTVTGINVSLDSSGQVVTLSGRVASEAQKSSAGQAASEVSGVTKVINDLDVRP